MMDCCKNGQSDKNKDHACGNSSCDCRSSMSMKHAKAKLILRVAAGLILVMHGYAKLNGGMDMFTGMVAGLGFPMPTLFAYLAALTEFVGGLCLMLGLATRPAAALITINMLVAWGMAKKFNLPKGDIDLMLVATSVAFLLSGPGKLSLDSKCCKEKSK